MTRSLLVLLAALLSTSAAATDKPRIAIIIDDLGYEWEAGLRVLALPAAITCAILPDAPTAARLANAAKQAGKEIIVHLPLQAMNHEGPTEPGRITLDTSAKEFSRVFERALKSVPHAVGVNNHRGSLLTRHPGHMQWLMDNLLRAETLFFVDSFTTHHSVALQIANESGVPAVKRDVFLDSSREPAHISRELERLKVLAREAGHAVAIGHPYPETIAMLEQALPELIAEGFDIVSVSQLIRPN